QLGAPAGAAEEIIPFRLQGIEARTLADHIDVHRQCFGLAPGARSGWCEAHGVAAKPREHRWFGRTDIGHWLMPQDGKAATLRLEFASHVPPPDRNASASARRRALA